MADYAESREMREEMARDHIARLADLSDRGHIWDVCRNFAIGSDVVEKLIAAERLKRGEISILDLKPALRRALVDPENLDLHAIAAGPIMDSNRIYLPAGRVSLAEAMAREAALILDVSNG
jgi:hypothetical protein